MANTMGIASKAKVFWFFSSEKNYFLPACARPCPPPPGGVHTPLPALPTRQSFGDASAAILDSVKYLDEDQRMDQDVQAVRRFNRFFTQMVGALDANFLDTGMTLAEARVLFEIAHNAPCFADAMQNALDLDAGFLSRVLRRFEARGWVQRDRLGKDARRRTIRLLPAGREVFDRLDQRQRREVEGLLGRLGEADRRRLVSALDTARHLMGGGEAASFRIRTFGPGDMGLIASRQAVLYRDAFGWGYGIEVNEGEVVTNFLRNFKPGREQCWVAEVDGQMAGSIFLTDEGNGLSRLRLLYVEPVFQGLGIGDALVSTCISFAREVGYARMTLWTHTILETARRIYARHGFHIVDQREHNAFGPTLMGETWELALTLARPKE
jgi:DNA-binding MarR family transcriptional regulator/N-acetylglutamate synthase-like GNAT family acetyltransferase